jgi:hypothetical protein
MESPNSICWDQKLMQPPLLKSLEEGKIHPYPGWELHDHKIEEEGVVRPEN